MINLYKYLIRILMVFSFDKYLILYIQQVEQVNVALLFVVTVNLNDMLYSTVIKN